MRKGKFNSMYTFSEVLFCSSFVFPAFCVSLWDFLECFFILLFIGCSIFVVCGSLFSFVDLLVCLTSVQFPLPRTKIYIYIMSIM